MVHPLDRRSFLARAMAGAAAGMFGSGNVLANAVAADPGAAIEAERDAIRTGMAQGDIGAAAVCLVDGGAPAWVEGFGRTSAQAGRAVADDTLFSIQSTSKNFTAVAVLLAVQEGLLDLDAPISRYLPDFTVHSRFERRPQDRITLRLLLGNRAGFTHEAPVGNNYEADSPGFEAHVRSISETWLRFPVGERYRYSNLGLDLAGYILGRQTGMGYAQWLRRKLFAPLGMRDSTADAQVYSGVANRALGSQSGYTQVPPVTPLVASGGVWTSARDMANYLGFHLGRGRWQGRQVLSRELWDEMHGFAFGGDYSLGVMRTELRHGTTPVRLLHHRGGGFGFGCVFAYCPDAGLGWAAMFNRAASAGYRFGEPLIDKRLRARFGARAPRLPATALAPIRPTDAMAHALVGNYVGRNVRAHIDVSDGQLQFRREGKEDAATPLGMESPDDLFITGPDGETTTYRRVPATTELPAHLECALGEESLDRNDGPDDPAGPGKAGWDRHLGRYRVDQWGKPSMDLAVEKRNGYLYLDGIRLVVETEAGLFFTSDGEAVDFRSDPPTWRNLLLRRQAA